MAIDTSKQHSHTLWNCVFPFPPLMVHLQPMYTMPGFDRWKKIVPRHAATTAIPFWYHEYFQLQIPQAFTCRGRLNWHDFVHLITCVNSLTFRILLQTRNSKDLYIHFIIVINYHGFMKKRCSVISLYSKLINHYILGHWKHTTCTLAIFFYQQRSPQFTFFYKNW